MTLIILFGPTGAGKTYVGKLIQKYFGYYFYDGDADLTSEMIKALNTMKPISNPMRDRFFERLLVSVDKLTRRHTKLVVAQTFIKEKYRREILAHYPKAKFILVKTKRVKRYQRLLKRPNYPWNKAYIKQMDALFETPKIPHQVLTNDSSGQAHLKAALRRLLLRL